MPEPPRYRNLRDDSVGASGVGLREVLCPPLLRALRLPRTRDVYLAQPLPQRIGRVGAILRRLAQTRRHEGFELERDIAIDLLRQPIPASEGFPEDAVPADVAEAIVDRTGGQPYLTQLYGFWLVEELNRQKRRRAELADVESVDTIVCDKAGSFFRDCLEPRGARFEVRPVIEQIVAGQTPELTGAQSRFLVRRGLITADGKLAFPILARWLNEFSE